MTTTPKKKIAINSPEYDAAYDAFVQGLELVGLGLKSCRADLDRGSLFALEKPIKTFNHKYRVTEFSDKTFDAEGSFEVAMAESEEKVPAAKIECVFEVHFHGESPVYKEHVERFVGSELRLVLVPLARQFFFSLSGQMGIPPVVVPLTTRFSGKAKKKRTQLTEPATTEG